MLLVPCDLHCRFELVAIDDDAAMTLLLDLTETGSDPHAYLHIFRIDIDYLSSETGSFVQLDLSNYIWKLPLEVFRCLPNHRERVNLAQSLELVIHKIPLPSTGRANWAWWEEVGSTGFTLVALDIVN